MSRRGDRPAAIDPDFTLGSVIDYSGSEPKRHHFLEVDSGRLTITGGTPTITVSPPQGLSDDELQEWEAR